MKKRLDFVTNSSSSCFIVCKKNNCKYETINKDITIGRRGEYNFCNSDCKGYDFYSRLNFLALQALYYKDAQENDEWIDKLNKCFYDVTGHKLKWNFINKEYLNGDAYIDHQSIYYQEESIEKIFKDDNLIKNFLFDKESEFFIGRDGDYIDEISSEIINRILNKDWFASGTFYTHEGISDISIDELNCLID